MSDHEDLTEELRGLVLEAECCSEGLGQARKDLTRLEGALGRLDAKLGAQIERRDDRSMYPLDREARAFARAPDVKDPR